MLLQPEKDGRRYHHKRDYVPARMVNFRMCRECSCIYNADKRKRCPNCDKDDPRIARLTF